MEGYEDSQIEQLLKSVDNLRTLHEDVCMIEHAMYEGQKRYMPYEPTYFLYNYFCFNTIFNIDWNQSLQEGDIKEGDSSEEKRIKNLIDFCFDPPGFADSFFPTFFEIATVRYSLSEIDRAMETIFEDDRRIDKTFIATFKSSYKKLLTERGFNVRDMKTVFAFIYSVRCNIVHGTKSMLHLQESKQRTWIMVYSFFIIALVHMLFMNLRSRSEGYYSGSMSESFLTRLKRHHNKC